ncbi:MAG: hypothetical protein ISQ32_03845 [Rickettsiales bacterium]|nr:hypothetical protein [Rickettsiales bacterium]
MRNSGGSGYKPNTAAKDRRFKSNPKGGGGIKGNTRDGGGSTSNQIDDSIIDRNIKFEKFLEISESTDKYDDFVIWEQNVGKTFQSMDDDNKRKSYVQRILDKYIPLHPMMGRTLTEDNVNTLFGKQKLNGLDYKFIINALEKNAEIIIPILQKFKQFYDMQNYSDFYPFELKPDDNKYFLTLKYLRDNKGKDIKPEEITKSNIKLGRFKKSDGNKDLLNILKFINGFSSFKASIKDELDKISADGNSDFKNNLIADLFTLAGLVSLPSYRSGQSFNSSSRIKTKNDPDYESRKKQRFTDIEKIIGENGARKKYKEFKQNLLPFSSTETSKLPGYLTSAPYLHQRYKFIDKGLLTNEQARFVGKCQHSILANKIRIQYPQTYKSIIENYKSDLQDPNKTPKLSETEKEFFLNLGITKLDELNPVLYQISQNGIKPVTFYSPAGSGKTVTAQKLEDTIFVTSVRTDADGTTKLSYKDFFEQIPLQHHAFKHKNIVFDEFESQKVDTKTNVKKLCKSLQAVQINLSATPNPFIQLIKSNRVFVKGLDRSTLYSANKDKKFKDYHKESTILLQKRSDIIDKLTEELKKEESPNDLNGIKGFHLFYSDTNNIPVDLISKVQSNYSIKDNTKIVIAYIDDNNQKQYIKYDSNTNRYTQPSVLSKDTDFSEEINDVNTKIVCCYDVGKLDHIGVDYHFLSKDNYCQARVIDFDIQQNNLSLNDWVQLYGRVRTSTASIENATASNALPLILSKKSKESMGSDYLQNLNLTEAKYLKEAESYVEGKIRSISVNSELQNTMVEIDKISSEYIDTLLSSRDLFLNRPLKQGVYSLNYGTENILKITVESLKQKNPEEIKKFITKEIEKFKQTKRAEFFASYRENPTPITNSGITSGNTDDVQLKNKKTFYDVQLKMLKDYEIRVDESPSTTFDSIKEIIKNNQRFLIESIYYKKSNSSQVSVDPRDVKSFKLPFVSEFKKEISCNEYILIAIAGKDTTTEFLEEIYKNYLPNEEKRKLESLQLVIDKFNEINISTSFQDNQKLFNFLALMKFLDLNKISEFKTKYSSYIDILEHNQELLTEDNLTKILNFFKNFNSENIQNNYQLYKDIINIEKNSPVLEEIKTVLKNNISQKIHEKLVDNLSKKKEDILELNFDDLIPTEFISYVHDFSEVFLEFKKVFDAQQKAEIEKQAKAIEATVNDNKAIANLIKSYPKYLNGVENNPINILNRISKILNSNEKVDLQEIKQLCYQFKNIIKSSSQSVELDKLVRKLEDTTTRELNLLREELVTQNVSLASLEQLNTDLNDELRSTKLDIQQSNIAYQQQFNQQANQIKKLQADVVSKEEELTTLKTSKQEELEGLRSQYQDNLKDLQEQVRVAEEEKAAATSKAQQLSAQLEELNKTSGKQFERQQSDIQSLTEKLQVAIIEERQANESSVLATNGLATAKLQFDKQVAVLEAQIREISLTSHKLQQANEALVAEKSALEEQAEANQLENARLTGALKEKETALQELRDQNEDLQTRLTENDAEIDILKGTILAKGSDLEQENAELRNELKALESTKIELGKIFNEQLSQIETLTGESDTARQALEAQQTQMELQASKSQERIEGLQGTIAEKDVLIRDLQRQNLVLEREKQALEVQLEASEAKVADNKQKITSLEGENVSLRQTNTEIRGEISRLKTKLRELERNSKVVVDENKEEIERLKAEIRDQNTLLEENQDKLSANTSQISELETQNETLKGQVKYLEGKLKQSEEELTAARSQIVTIDGMYRNQVKLVEQKEEEIEGLRAENEELNGKNVELDKELSELETQMQQIDEGALQAITKAREEADKSVEAKTEEFEKAKKDLQEQIDTKQAELDANKERLTEIDSRISHLETENRTLKGQVTKLEQQLKDNEEANQKIQEKLTAEKARADEAERVFEEFQTTAMRTQTELTAELDAKTAELEKLLKQQKEIDQVLQPGFVSVQTQSSGQGRAEREPQSIADKIQALQLEIAGLREANSSLTESSVSAQARAQEKLAEQKRQTDLATTIIAEINAFQYQDQSLSFNESINSGVTDLETSEETVDQNTQKIEQKIYNLLNTSIDKYNTSVREKSDSNEIEMPLDIISGFSDFVNGIPEISSFSGLIENALVNKFKVITTLETQRQLQLQMQIFDIVDSLEEDINFVNIDHDEALFGDIKTLIEKIVNEQNYKLINEFLQKHQLIDSNIKEIITNKFILIIGSLDRDFKKKQDELIKKAELIPYADTNGSSISGINPLRRNQFSSDSKSNNEFEDEIKEIFGNFKRYKEEFIKQLKLTNTLKQEYSQKTLVELKQLKPGPDDYQYQDSDINTSLLDKYIAIKTEEEYKQNAAEREADLTKQLEVINSDKRKLQSELEKSGMDRFEASELNKQREEGLRQKLVNKMISVKEEGVLRKAFSNWKDQTAKSKLAESQEKVAQLEKNNEEVIEKFRGSLVEERAAQAKSQKENTELREALQGLRTQLDISGFASEAQKSQITAQLVKIEELQTGNSNLQEANRKQREQLLIQQAELESSNYQLVEEKQDIELQLAEIEYSLRLQDEELREAESAARAKGVEITRLGQENTVLQQQIESAKQRIGSAEEAAESALDEVGATKEQNTELLTNLQGLQDELKQNQRQLEAAKFAKVQQEEAVRKLSNDIEASQRENQVLIARNALLDAQITSQTQKIRDLGIALGKAETERDRARAENQGIREVVQQLTSQVSIQSLTAEFNATNFQQSLSNINGHLVRTNEELRAKSQEFDRVKEELGTAQAALQQERVENARLVEKVSSFEQQVGEKTDQLEALQKEVVAQQEAASRLTQSNIDLSLQLSDSKGKLDVKDQETKQLIDAQAQASEKAAEARRSFEELQGQYADLQAIKVQLTEANAQIKRLQDLNTADLRTAAAEQEVAVANVRTRMMQTLSEQREELQREKEDAVTRVTEAAETKLREQREKEGLVASQREAAQQNAEIIQRMNTLIRDQATQNRAETEALKKQIVDMQIAHAAATAQIRQDNQLLQQQIIAANVEAETVKANAAIKVAEISSRQTMEELKLQQEQLNANIDLNNQRNQIEWKRIFSEREERQAQREHDVYVQERANLENLENRYSREMQEFQESIDQKFQSLNRFVDNYNNLQSLSRDDLIKIATESNYENDLPTKIQSLAKINDLHTFIELDFTNTSRPNLRVMDIKPPSEEAIYYDQNQFDQIIELKNSYTAVLQSKKNILKKDNLLNKAKNQLYDIGDNFKNNDTEYLDYLLTQNLNTSHSHKQNILDSLQPVISRLAGKDDEEAKALFSKVAEVSTNLGGKDLFMIAYLNKNAFGSNPDNQLTRYSDLIINNANSGSKIINFIKNIKNQDALNLFIDELLDNDEKLELVINSDNRCTFLNEMIAKRYIEDDLAHDLLDSYKDYNESLIDKKYKNNKAFKARLDELNYKDNSQEFDFSQLEENHNNLEFDRSAENRPAPEKKETVSFESRAFASVLLPIFVASAILVAAPAAVLGAIFAAVATVAIVNIGINYNNKNIEESNAEIRRNHTNPQLCNENELNRPIYPVKTNNFFQEQENARREQRKDSRTIH